MTPTSGYLKRPLRSEAEVLAEREAARVASCTHCEGEGWLAAWPLSVPVPCPICNKDTRNDAR